MVEPISIISGSVAERGFIPTWLWQLILPTFLAVIGYGVKRVVDNLKTLTATVSGLSTIIATTGVEVRFQGEQSDERYHTLVARAERLEDKQDVRGSQTARIETKLDKAVEIIKTNGTSKNS